MEAINTSFYRNFDPFMHPFLHLLSPGHYNATWKDVLQSKKDGVGIPRTLYAVGVDTTAMCLDNFQESAKLIRRRSCAGRWVCEGTKDVIFTSFLSDVKFFVSTLDHNFNMVQCWVAVITRPG